MRNNNLTFWMETEACIVNHNWEILPKVWDLSSFEFIQKILQERFRNWIDKLVERVSPEELWHQIEIKNIIPVRSIEEWVEEIIRDIQTINGIKEIREKFQLVLTPVSQNDFEAIPSIWDKEAHQRKLFDSMIEKFGPEEWLKIVKSFATFSNQLNIWWLFDWIEWSIDDEDFQELARRFLNEITEMKDLLLSKNWKVVNWEWKTRQDIANEVLTKLKWDSFDDKTTILIPPHFNSTKEMIEWIWNHSWIKSWTDIDKFSDLQEKDMHSFLAKIKREDFLWVETRFADASNDFETFLNTNKILIKRLLKVKEEFIEEIKLKIAA